MDEMNETIRQDILAVLNQLTKILGAKQAKDASEIEELSNHTIHNASIFQDKESISTAVIVYSIYKMTTRGLDDKEYGQIENGVSEMKYRLEKNELGQYEKQKKRLLETISDIDSKFGLYISKVVNQANVKKGSGIYSHGISLAQTASILGISQWELMSYVGKTRIVDYGAKGVSEVNRINFARGLFR